MSAGCVPLVCVTFMNNHFMMPDDVYAAFIRACAKGIRVWHGGCAGLCLSPAVAESGKPEWIQSPCLEAFWAFFHAVRGNGTVYTVKRFYFSVFQHQSVALYRPTR